MTRSLLLTLGLVFGGYAFAQDDMPPPPPDSAGVDDTRIETQLVQVMPEFPGGQEALAKFMVDEVKYPKKARRAGTEGRVLVTFIVDKDGAVTDVSIARGVDPLLDEEAMRAVRLMPKWKPGTQNGKPVKTKFNLPVLFKLKG
ncbi:MAG: energy transducer TonB [Flavobacteriales bacterium]|nr:energy transducer TonB [Flavobacteriales bacterium]MBK9288940.1 energy transducer TonB [Flavobacteriales bacterium]